MTMKYHLVANVIIKPGGLSFSIDKIHQGKNTLPKFNKLNVTSWTEIIQSLGCFYSISV